MSKIIVVLFFSLIILLLSCNTTEPPPPEKTITLSLEDAASVEAWIKLKTTNLQLPATITLEQSAPGGAGSRSTINLVKPDTLLYIDSLLPNTTYSFQASSIQHQVSSNELSATTMDTTSHNFTWQTFTFGEHSSSVLNDVAIIDENNIWAVGEIYMNDSLGQPDPHAYNAVHWDGNTWLPQKITVEFRGNLITPPLYGVFAFSNNDIWFSSGVPIRGDGENWTQYHLFDMGILGQDDGSIKKIWGNNSSDIYFVGNKGTIAHYSGPTGGWQKIESGTETRINDAWGIISNENKTILYCPVSSFFVPGDKKILKITDRKVDSVAWNRDARLYSAWAINENFLYVCGEGGFENKTGKWEEINIPLVSMTSIRGNDINDIFIVGGNGFKAHFNGVGWKTYNIMNNNGYMAISVKDNTVAVSGRQLGYGLIEIGTRN